MGPSVDMPPQTIIEQIWYSSSKCQASSTVLSSGQRVHYGTSGPQATLIKSVSDCLGRGIHTSGVLEVIL